MCVCECMYVCPSVAYFIKAIIPVGLCDDMGNSRAHVLFNGPMGSRVCVCVCVCIIMCVVIHVYACVYFYLMV